MAQVFPVYNWSFNQGSTVSVEFQYTEEDGVTPIDLTGYTARMQLRQLATSETAVITLTTEDGGITIDPLVGKVTISMTAVQTAAIPAKTYKYDIELVTMSGLEEVVYRLIEGDVTCRVEITRD